MRPRLICHMTSSVDGRALVPLWHPADVVPNGLWESARARLGADASIMGGLPHWNMQGSSPYRNPPKRSTESIICPFWTRQLRLRDRPTKNSLTWGRGDIDGAPIVVVVAESTSDRYLAGLRSEGIYYSSWRRRDRPWPRARQDWDLGIRNLYLDGGPATADSSSRGSIDEISLLLLPPRRLPGSSHIRYRGERENPPFPSRGCAQIH